MSTVVTVIFDGQVFRPEVPLDLEPNRRYRVTIEPAPAPNTATDAWDLLADLAGTIEAPPDWSSEHDHYLYGTPKRHLESQS
ncbi:antitoxin family protein [Gloeobacter morelensis]|uniref:Antitoxin family protein n=1 Tax=Gloeobacter morelensis MG652769 TaxID=2781736 RepID=A0ABY3PLW3_9CYAN|nr:antitoxin family protein [Gloeobacter morelensis]UFP94681.1 antitoxin family protein [Gloeobacter morelensis MG652769]